MVWLNTESFSLWNELDRFRRTAQEMVRGALPELSVEGPRANVRTTADEAFVELLVPGFAPDEVTITAESNRLLVTGERRTTEANESNGTNETGDSSVGGTDDGEKGGRIEASFERRFRLPFAIEMDAVEAKLEHGVLEIRAPRSQAERPRVIRIN